MAQTTNYISINMHQSLLLVDAEIEKISHDFLECSCWWICGYAQIFCHPDALCLDTECLIFSRTQEVKTALYEVCVDKSRKDTSTSQHTVHTQTHVTYADYVFVLLLVSVCQNNETASVWGYFLKSISLASANNPFKVTHLNKWNVNTWQTTAE